MLSQDARLSVRHTLVLCKRILKLLSASGSHTIPVFSHQTLWQYSDGIDCRYGMKKIAIFDQDLALSRK